MWHHSYRSAVCCIVRYNFFLCSTTHMASGRPLERKKWLPLHSVPLGTGVTLHVESVKEDAGMEQSRRNWTRNLPCFKELMWQMSLSWGRGGGWVMGRKNWMNFRVSFSLTRTGWSSRQMWRREVPWRERGISKVESGGDWRGRERRSLRWPATARRNTGEVLGREGLPTGKYGFSDGKRAKWNDMIDTEQGLAVGRIWRSLLSWQRTLWSDCTRMLACHHLLGAL